MRTVMNTEGEFSKIDKWHLSKFHCVLRNLLLPLRGQRRAQAPLGFYYQATATHTTGRVRGGLCVTATQGVLSSPPASSPWRVSQLQTETGTSAFSPA